MNHLKLPVREVDESRERQAASTPFPEETAEEEEVGQPRSPAERYIAEKEKRQREKPASVSVHGIAALKDMTASERAEALKAMMNNDKPMLPKAVSSQARDIAGMDFGLGSSRGFGGRSDALEDVASAMNKGFGLGLVGGEGVSVDRSHEGQDKTKEDPLDAAFDAIDWGSLAPAKLPVDPPPRSIPGIVIPVRSGLEKAPSSVWFDDLAAASPQRGGRSMNLIEDNGKPAPVSRSKSAMSATDIDDFRTKLKGGQMPKRAAKGKKKIETSKAGIRFEWMKKGNVEKRGGISMTPACRCDLNEEGIEPAAGLAPLASFSTEESAPPCPTLDKNAQNKMALDELMDEPFDGMNESLLKVREDPREAPPIVKPPRKQGRGRVRGAGGSVPSVCPPSSSYGEGPMPISRGQKSEDPLTAFQQGLLDPSAAFGAGSLPDGGEEAPWLGAGGGLGDDSSGLTPELLATLAEATATLPAERQLAHMPTSTEKHMMGRRGQRGKGGGPGESPLMGSDGPGWSLATQSGHRGGGMAVPGRGTRTMQLPPTLLSSLGAVQPSPSFGAGDQDGFGASWTGGVGRERGMRNSGPGFDSGGFAFSSDETAQAIAGANFDLFMSSLEYNRFETTDPLPGVTRGTAGLGIAPPGHITVPRPRLPRGY